MALPTSGTWDLVDFEGSSLPLLLSAAEVSISPSATPYFVHNSGTNTVTARSDDSTLATADITVGVPNRFTFQTTLRFPEMPESTGDLGERRIGFTISDDAGRGVSVYFSKQGISVSRIDDFGSVTALPDSTEFTSEVDSSYHVLRVAVDSGLGRAYIFVGSESDPFPPLRFIVPVRETPAAVGDRFRIFTKGTASDPTSIEFKSVRLTSGLFIPNFPPTADAGPDRVLPVGQAARLDGRGSFDLEGAPLTYQWRAIDAPFNSKYAYDGSDGSTTDDGDGDSFTDKLSFSSGSLPSWVAEGDVLVIDETRHVIDTVDNGAGELTVTTDTIGDSYSGQPFRIIRQSLLVGADTETPYLIPDIAGLYRIELIVNDGEIDSEPNEVLVSAVSARAPLGIEPDVSPLQDAIGDEWRFVENREVFHEFWKGIAQVMGAKLLETWQYHYNFNIRDAQETFQRKWIAYRTLIPETEPAEAIISPRYGLFIGTHDFSGGTPSVTSSTLVFEYFTGDSATETDTTTVTLTGDTIATIESDINGAVGSLDIEAYSITDSSGSIFLGIRSGNTAFKILSSSTAAGALGLTTDEYNYLRGTKGSRVTDRSYRVDDGIDLQKHGVKKDDLLSINNGQVFRIERVITDPADPSSNQRIIVSEPLPFDATEEWEIPSIVRSDEVDYEREGSYPGDLVKTEIYDRDEAEFSDANGIVIGQRGTAVGARLDAIFAAFTDTDRYELRLLGVKRRKGVPIPDDVLSIPRLQDKVPQDQSPTMWKENVDFYLEPFYREEGAEAVPYLQFRDSVFINPNIEPPDIFWAELTVFSNAQNVENLFGRLVGFLREHAENFDEDISYVSATAGLLYAHQRGPNVDAMETGLQILFGQPFAEVDGIITEIRPDYSPTTGRMLVQDDDGYDPPRSEVVRSYVWRKDPLDSSLISGLANNPETGKPYEVDDEIKQFAAIGAGVQIVDYINDPTWYVPYVNSGVITELEKFFYFVAEFNLDLVTLANLSLIHQFIFRIKPTYTQPFLVGIRGHEDDIDIEEVRLDGWFMDLHDSTCEDTRSFIYDDFRGDGTTWSDYDDGSTFYDGFIDCPEDYIELKMTIDWPGGIITYDSIFFYDTEVIDDDGAYTGTPGSTFDIEYDLNLPAGSYSVIGVIDSGTIVLP